MKSFNGQRDFVFIGPDAVDKDVFVHIAGLKRSDVDRQLLDLESVRSELKPFYSTIGRPSVAPELMIRMLVIGY